MSLTKRWLETQPAPEKQALDAARRDVYHAARIIEAESPLDWQDRQAAGRALASALTRLTELERLVDEPERAHFRETDFVLG